MAESLLVITHDDGRSYAVSEDAYKASYEAQGFVCDRHEDGTPYPAPPDPLGEAIGEKGAESLRAAGLGGAEAIAAADDATLLAVPGIGAASVEKLRALAPSAASAPQVDADETKQAEG